MKDGKVRRIPADQAEALIDSRQAKRYISNTIYRAVKAGIEVKDFGTRDEDGSLREAVRALRKKAAQRKAKKDREKAKKKETQVESE